MKTNIKFIRQSEVRDIFSFLDENAEIDYIDFPRTMEMSLIEVEDYLNQ